MGPDELRYSREHEWVSVEEDGAAIVGITDYAQDELGDKVVINIDSGIQKGRPHKRFQGKVATVVEKRGNAFVLDIPQRKTSKLVIARREHIQKHKG